MNNREIVTKSIVTVRQGDKILVRKAYNHFVDAGLKGIISTLIFAWAEYAYSNGGYGVWNLWQSAWHIYLGSDITTATITTMNSLVSPIGATPGTPPDSKSIVPTDGSADGDWYATFTATWNAGTVPAVTLGELALYMRAPDKSTFQWGISGITYTPVEVMISRLSSADLDFSSFVIDDAEPLTVDWEVHFTFA